MVRKKKLRIGFLLVMMVFGFLLMFWLEDQFSEPDAQDPLMKKAMRLESFYNSFP